MKEIQNLKDEMAQLVKLHFLKGKWETEEIGNKYYKIQKEMNGKRNHKHKWN